MQNRIRVIVAVAASVWLAAEASAQTVNVQPAEDQSAEQMQKDMAECQAQAKQSTGYDPAAPPPADSSDSPEVGGRARGAAAGAMAGAAAAEVRGRQHDEAYDRLSDDAKQQYRRNEAESAAAAGAVVGASRQRRERRAGRQEQQEAQAQAETAASAYEQAYGACLTERNYPVSP